MIPVGATRDGGARWARQGNDRMSLRLSAAVVAAQGRGSVPVVGVGLAGAPLLTGEAPPGAHAALSVPIALTVLYQLHDQLGQVF